MAKHKEETVIKYPLKRFETTLGKSLRIVIPTNLDRLRKHRSNIEKVIQIKLMKQDIGKISTDFIIV